MNEYPEIAERFAKDTAEHAMDLRHDEGLHRQIRFSAPGSLDWFDLITWPYNLIVNGSHGSYHFCRFGQDTEDMFALFRHGAAGRRINPSYWAEKTRAGEVKSWSADKFRQWLLNKATELEARYRGVMDAVDRQILNSDEHNFDYEETARFAVDSFHHDDARLVYPQAWETEFVDYDWKYLWSCHAVAWGISQYDKQKAATPEAVAR